MDTFPLLLTLALVLAVGLALGAVIGVLWSRSRPQDDAAVVMARAQVELRMRRLAIHDRADGAQQRLVVRVLALPLPAGQAERPPLGFGGRTLSIFTGR